MDYSKYALVCPRKHFADANLAVLHLRKHNSGRGFFRECACGKGWFTSSQPVPNAEPVLRTQFPNRHKPIAPVSVREPAPKPAPAEPEQEHVPFLLNLDMLQQSCFRKCRYTSEDVAKKVIARRQFDGRAYACRGCGGWHITKAPLRERQAYR